MLIDYFFFPMFEKNIAVFSGKHRHLSLKSIHKLHFRPCEGGVKDCPSPAIPDKQGDVKGEGNTCYFCK